MSVCVCVCLCGVWCVVCRYPTLLLQMQFVIALQRCAHIIMVKCLSSVMERGSGNCWRSRRRVAQEAEQGAGGAGSLIKCANCVRASPKNLKDDNAAEAGNSRTAG